MVITEQGMTLWQLSENYLDSKTRAIGQLESPVSLFEWVLNNAYPNKILKIADKIFGSLI